MDAAAITDVEYLRNIERLCRYRLERDLTFEQLADEMTEAGYPLKARALHNTLSGHVSQRERTRFKIGEFAARISIAEDQQAKPKRLQSRHTNGHRRRRVQG